MMENIDDFDVLCVILCWFMVGGFKWEEEIMFCLLIFKTRDIKKITGIKFKLWHFSRHRPLGKKWRLPLGNAKTLWRISQSDREFILRWETIKFPGQLIVFIRVEWCRAQVRLWQFNALDLVRQQLITNWFCNNCVKGDYFFPYLDYRSREIAMTHWSATVELMERSIRVTMCTAATIEWSRQTRDSDRGY